MKVRIQMLRCKKKRNDKKQLTITAPTIMHFYTDLHRKTNKSDRLKAGYTLSRYEKAYTQAFIAAAKAADPTWTAGKPIKAGALDGITRESVESQLAKSGNKLVKKICIREGVLRFKCANEVRPFQYVRNNRSVKTVY